MVCHWLWMRKSGLNDSKQIDSLQSDQGHGLLAWLLWQGPVFCNMIHVYKSHMEQKTKLQYLFDISIEKENKRVLYSSFFFQQKQLTLEQGLWSLSLTSPLHWCDPIGCCGSLLIHTGVSREQTGSVLMGQWRCLCSVKRKKIGYTS